MIQDCDYILTLRQALSYRHPLFVTLFWFAGKSHYLGISHKKEWVTDDYMERTRRTERRMLREVPQD
jgi:hypothetical protein